MTSTDMSFMDAMAFFYGANDRQGPGDDDFAKQLLQQLPTLPDNPKIIDLGCGTGPSSLLLAEFYNSEVISIDLMPDFADKLKERAHECGLSHLIKPVTADMGALGSDYQDVDLLWAEGSAYNLTFPVAINAWRGLMKDGALAVISELNWIADERPEDVSAFWLEEYPQMIHERDNAAIVQDGGYEIVAIKRLPFEAGWDNYYAPLLKRCGLLKEHGSEQVNLVAQAHRIEADMYEKARGLLSFSYFVLKAV